MTDERFSGGGGFRHGYLGDNFLEEMETTRSRALVRMGRVRGGARGYSDQTRVRTSGTDDQTESGHSTSRAVHTSHVEVSFIFE